MELGRWLQHAYAILIVLFLHINASSSLGHDHANVTAARCVEREREALLAIKGGLVDEYNLLSSWGSDDCCGWERVHCDPHTGHVIQLHLGGVPGVDSLSRSEGELYFTGMQEMMFLQGESISKTLQGEISPKIIELQYLQYLDLSYNFFSATQIPALICSLFHLRHLDLRSNHLTGTSQIPKLIGNMTNLRHLDLSGNFIVEIPASMGSLSNLRHLDLSLNYLNMSKIPKLIGNLTNLRYLDLSWNYLLGHEVAIPYYQLGNLTHLQYLNLRSIQYFTALDGNENLHWLPHLSSLEYLDLSWTNLSKASNWLETINKLPNLRNLTLPGCDLPPPILSTLSHINSSSSLVSIDLSENSIVSSSIFKWLSNYNTTLAYLYLSSTELSGSIPHILTHMSSLTYLDLSSNQFSALNPNAFANMSSLKYLDLSSNQFNGSIPNVFINMRALKGLSLSFNQFSGVNPNAFANMSSLTYLDLSSNPLDGGIPTSIAQLCSLQYLYISNCNLTGQLSESVQKWSTCPQNPFRYLDFSNNSLTGSFPDFTNFSSLKNLDLSINRLSGKIPDSISKLSSLEVLSVQENQLRWMIPESIGRLVSLRSLDLSENLLSGRIPESIGQLTSLEVLDLSRNQLSGGIPESIGRLSSLWRLNLQENLLSGRIPESIGQLSSLIILDLSRNWLRESIPESIGQLSNLFFIHLSMNHLEGEVLETHFSKLFSLMTLDFSNNSLLEFNVTTGWIPPFQLYELSLRSCKVGPKFPKWLRTQERLSSLDMSYTDISDVLPSWVWGAFANGSTIDFSNNQIRGRLGSSQTLSTNAVEIRLSSNHLGGSVPSFLSNVSYIDLSDNNISDITSFLCSSNVKISKFLDLSKNQIIGEVPDCWRQWTNLELLDLSFNAFSGKIPPSFGSLVGIKTLKLRSNKLVGELPSSLKNCKSLNVIDLGNNQLSSSVPQWLGTGLPDLVILMLQFNQLGGSLPSELCQLAHLQILDVSVNQISGSIPKCLKNLTTLAQEGNSNLTIRHSFNISEAEAPMSSLYYEDDETFMWKGTLSSYKSTLGLVKRIDLSSNRLNGEIPTEITHLVGLVSLNLSRNNLTGQIPLEIGKLKSLDSLDLSRNKIHGGIPMSLAHIDGLGYMNLSYNNLSGEIPTGTQLQSFNASSYIGNPWLCGLPLDACNPEGTGRPNVSSGEEDEDELISLGFYISMGLGFAVGFWGVCGGLIFKKSWRYAYYNYLDSSNDWLYVKLALIRLKLKDMVNGQQS